jgi:hypothetical protein
MSVIDNMLRPFFSKPHEPLKPVRKPLQPRCSCGRYCSSHEEVPDMKAKLISELSAQHKHVPGYFRKGRA